MNAEQLLGYFDRISEAPGAIPRLRRFILDLAVRGKLVAQDTSDEPASELIERIEAHKARLAGRGRLKVPKRCARLNGGQTSSKLRRGWQTATIADLLVEIQTGPFGSSLHQSDYQKDGVPVVNPASVQGERIIPIPGMAVGPQTLERLSTFKLRAGDIVMARRGEMGRCAVVSQREDGWLCGTGSLILRVFPQISSHFLVMLIGSPVFRHYLTGAAVGTTMQNLNQSILLNASIDVPPLAEQRRIVTKVHEVMALCDRLEAAQTERERRRKQVALSSLQRLNRSSAEADLRQHVRFHLQLLPRVTNHPECIKELRQTILNLAIRGLLRANEAKDRCAEVGGAASADEHRPFAIPQNWTWSRLNELGHFRGGGTPSKSRDEFWGGRIPWVSPKDMKRDYVDSAQMTISDLAVANSAVTIIEPGSILFVVRGMILSHSFPVAIARVPLTINQDMKALTLRDPECGEFVLRALKALKPRMLARVQRSTHGTCRIEGPDYSNFLIPIPPLAEQHRIVAKVDELMGLCNKLESQLATAESESQRLLEAVLHRALAVA